MIILEEEKNRIRRLHGTQVLNEQWKKVNVNEEPEEDSYYVITKHQREDLINIGGVAKEIAGALPSYDKFKPN